MDDNFGSSVKAIVWRCCVNDSVHKFLQFQILTDSTATMLSFASAATSTEDDSVLSAAQPFGSTTSRIPSLCSRSHRPCVLRFAGSQAERGEHALVLCTHSQALLGAHTLCTSGTK